MAAAPMRVSVRLPVMSVQVVPPSVVWKTPVSVVT